MDYNELRRTIRFFCREAFTGLIYAVMHWLSFMPPEPVDREKFKAIPVSKKRLKVEIARAISSDTFSWKDLARENDFIYFSEKKTNNEIFLCVQVCIWEHLYPEDVLGDSSLKQLYDLIIHTIKPKEWLSFDQIITDYLDAFDEQEPLLNYYNLLRFQHKFRRELELKNDEGENRYFVRFRQREKRELPKGLRNRKRREPREGRRNVNLRKVKDKIKEFIELENKKEPLSDIEISSLLTKEGLIIKEERVAGLREILGYSSAELRKDLTK